jgi:hypothetical protein
MEEVNRMNARSQDIGKLKFLQALAAGLKVEPAYLLIFALAALFFLFGLGAGVSAAIQQEPKLWYLAFGGLLVSLIAAVIVIRSLHPAAVPLESIQSGATAKTFSPSRDPSADEVMYAIHENVIKSLTFENETFRDAVLRECVEFRARTAAWSGGRIKAYAHWSQLLVGFFRLARRSVFSTTIPNFLSTWETSFGDQLLDAHRKSPAQVTRVFVFNNPQDVTPEAMAIMERQWNDRIDVRLHFSDGAKLFKFPPDISRDFTVIDHGEAIGITVSFGEPNLAAEWYIHDENQKQRFEQICNDLKGDSEEFSTFLKRWKNSSSG